MKNNGRCFHCGKQLVFKNYGRFGSPGAWEVDHNWPKNRGGTNHFRNLWPSCIHHNRSKKDTEPGVYHGTVLPERDRKYSWDSPPSWIK